MAAELVREEKEEASKKGRDNLGRGSQIGFILKNLARQVLLARQRAIAVGQQGTELMGSWWLKLSDGGQGSKKQRKRDNCRKASRSMQRCDREAYFCLAGCQAAAWKEHKKVCVKAA